MLAELVAILPLRPQETAIEDMGLCPVMADGHVDLTEINPCYLLTSSASMRLNLIGGNGFVLGARPVDHHRLRQFPRPIQDERSVAFAIGQAQLSILEQHGRTFVLDFE